MKKQITGSLAATAALLAIAGIAQAAPAELNIYGASAQYLFWNANSVSYAQRLGCTAGSIQNSADGKHGFLHSTGCTSSLVPVDAINNPTRALDIRYSGIASAEGPLAVDRKAPLLASGRINATKNADGSAATTTNNCVIANGERAMYDGSATTICKVVHIGTSDVAGETLTQSSTGLKLGPMAKVNGVNGYTGTTEVAITNSLPGVNTSNLTPHSTVVVPFGFFVNNAVTATQCTVGLVGNYCTTAAHCNTSPTATDGVCGSSATISNISRTQVAQIFSGQASDWSDFGAFFTPKQIVACLRHAGSGTHAAFETTVMNGGGTGWGTTMATLQQTGNGKKILAGGKTQIWFNDGASDMMNCVKGATTANNGALSSIGAIGYADADQVIPTNVVAVKYNGVYPTRSALRNGLYEFYSAAQLYTNAANGTASGYDPNLVAEDLVLFAQDPANIPHVTGTASDKANYWATVAEMNYMRGSDAGYPALTGPAFSCGVTGTDSCAQTP